MEETAFAQYFVGNSYLRPLAKTGNVFIANVKRWHGAKKDSWFSHILTRFLYR